MALDTDNHIRNRKRNPNISRVSIILIMSIDRLSTELLQRIYEYSTIRDVINLSKTTKKNHNAYLGCQLRILQKAIYNSPYSPFPELIKLVISGEPDNIRKPIGTELRRGAIVDRVISSTKVPPLSLDFIMKMKRYANVAERWTEIYPQLRWRYDSSSRRLLRPVEAQRLRKAIYQIWTYHNLFHDKLFCDYSPEPPPQASPPHRNDLRFRLARTWSTIDMVRQSEFMDKMRQLLEIDLYPSNAMVQYSFNKFLPEKMLAKLAWGEDDFHRPLIDTLLKVTPDDLLHLYQDTTTKQERVQYLLKKGHWFVSSASSFDETVHMLAMAEREYHGWCPPVFPSYAQPLRFPDVDLEDKDVEYGIVKNKEGEKTPFALYLKEHFSNDAIVSGEWVEEWQRPGFMASFEQLDDGEDSGDSANGAGGSEED
jgi:hypothetical protein